MIDTIAESQSRQCGPRLAWLPIAFMALVLTSCSFILGQEEPQGEPNDDGDTIDNDVDADVADTGDTQDVESDVVNDEDDQEEEPLPGEEGDPCEEASDCGDTAPFCGPDSLCHDGSAEDPCALDEECQDELLCGPEVCQLGSEGEACADATDCAAATPICSAALTCQDGSEGDACDAIEDCGEALYCEPVDEGQCRDGSAGDPCAEDEQCLEAAPLCGPEGCQVGALDEPCADDADCGDGLLCGIDVCQEGVEGDACAGDDDCSSELYCAADACFDGSLDDPCNEGGDCLGGRSCVDAPALDTSFCNEPSFVRIPAGGFDMGCPPNDGLSDTCSPNNTAAQQHGVTLTRDLVVLRQEVTSDAWDEEFENNPSEGGTCTTCPVNSVNWFDALAYANALSSGAGLEECYDLGDCTGTPGVVGGSGLSCSAVPLVDLDCTGYRLPTEAEWEYAARAGTETAFWSGELNPDDNVCDDELAPDHLLDSAWFCANSLNDLHTVGGTNESPWGLFDLAGNASEWVWDRYADYASGAQTNPLGPDAGATRVHRGGAYDDSPASCQHGSRFDELPTSRLGTVGFRLVRTVTAE